MGNHAGCLQRELCCLGGSDTRTFSYYKDSFGFSIVDAYFFFDIFSLYNVSLIKKGGDSHRPPDNFTYQNY